MESLYTTVHAVYNVVYVVYNEPLYTMVHIIYMYNYEISHTFMARPEKFKQNFALWSPHPILHIVYLLYSSIRPPPQAGRLAQP